MRLVTGVPVRDLRVAVAGVAAALMLAACSSAGGSSSPSTNESSAPTSSTPVAASAPAAQTVAMGATVALPADAIAVTAFTDDAAPRATKPEAPGTHWASAAVKQCATGASRQGHWELALEGGTTASETASWIEGELPHQLQPSNDPLSSGDCVSGDVFFVMPDGATATGVVLAPAVSAGRPMVTWTVS